ncbi:unnamed protein product, partial [marine sediment metagenome]
SYSNEKIVYMAAILTLSAASFAQAGPSGETISALEQLEEIALQELDSAEVMLPEIRWVSEFAQRAITKADSTGEYDAIWENIDCHFGYKAVNDLHNYKVIFVFGLLSDLYQEKFTDGYVKWLRKMGIDCERAAIESEESPSYNMPAIAKAIELADKPVIIIARSKGGLDVLYTLVENEHLLNKIRGIIMIQTPFFGSPLADYILNSTILNATAVKALNALGGSKKFLSSLATGKREEYYRQNRETITRIAGAVPFISFASWKDNEPGRLDTILELPRNIMAKAG